MKRLTRVFRLFLCGAACLVAVEAAPGQDESPGFGSDQPPVVDPPVEPARKPVKPPPIPAREKGSRSRGGRTGTGLSPQIAKTFSDAAQRAKKYDQLVLVYVTKSFGGDTPALFKDRKIAVASRMYLTLFVKGYSARDPFFKGRAYNPKDVPAVLIVDRRGNILRTLNVAAAPDQILRDARALRSMEKGILVELPKAEQRLDEAIAGGEPEAVVSVARPWLARHYRGFSAIDRMVEKVRAFGAPRVEAAVGSSEGLMAVARRFAGTPVEADALIELGRIHSEADDLSAVRTLCERVLNDMPWPEYAAAHKQAKLLMRKVRRAEIERRRKLLEDEGEAGSAGPS